MKKLWISLLLSQGLLLLLRGDIFSLIINQQNASQDQGIQSREERRREHFSPARELLRAHNVPFDPDILLTREWIKTLAPIFDRMPEMQTVRRETGPLQGV